MPSANPEIIHFLKNEIQKILKSRYTEEIVSAHIHPLMLDERQPIVIDKMNKIAAIQS